MQFKSLIFFWCCFLSSSFIYAQQDLFKIAPTQIPLNQVEKYTLPPVDNEQLQQELAIEKGSNKTLIFAHPFEVDITPSTHGTWEQLGSDLMVWRLRILSKDAYSLNLGFSDFYLPKQTKLLLYDADQKEVLGPFDKNNNSDYSQLWTPILESDEIVIELQVPVSLKNQVILQLSRVNHDFVNLSTALSGECNLDAICGTGDGFDLNDKYRELFDAVALINVGGFKACTGFLVNNTQQDCRQFFMTGNHCGVSPDQAPSVVIYWDYQNSVCRDTNTVVSGNTGDGLKTIFNTGTFYRASYRNTDLSLLEIKDSIPAEVTTYYAGWDRSFETPSDTVVTVHHPRAEEKRVSYSFQETYPGEWVGGAELVPTGQYLLVPFWDIGTTEIGSSGGPLFNKDGLVVGSLHGGLATCTSKSYDKFGWFAYSWEGGLTNSTQLKYWLDPIGEAPIQLEGREGRKCKLNIAPNNFSASICLQDTATYSFDLNQYFQENTQFDILQLPSSLGFEWGNNGARANETVELKLFTTDELESGRYFLPIQAVSEGETLTTFIELIVSNTSPLPVEPILPLNQQREISINPLFSWKSGNQDASFKIQLSEDSLFNTIFLEEENLDTTAFELNSDLPPGTVFYWRVQAFNLCGDAFWSTVRSFRTAEIVCSTITSENVPIEISTQGTPTITSAITISEPGQVNQVSVLNLQIDHTFVGDLAAALTSPSGTVVRLFDRPGVPASFAGCGGENLRLDFYDDATFTPNRIETFCGNLPAISGAHQALDPFSVFNNEPVQGDWILTITDNANQDGGNLISWSLDICASRSNGISLITPEVILENCIVNTLIFPLYIGEGFNADGVDLSINGLPEEAAINFTRNPAFPGDTVLISIANIQNVGKYLIEVSGNDNNGNIVIAPVQINQTDSPTAPIPLAPDNEEVISSLTPFFQWQADPLATTYSFELDDGDDFENPIVNTQLLEPSFFMQNPLRAGIYYWRISINNGCGTETSEIQSFIVSNTTSNNNLIPSGFKLYPNPAQNLINIELGKLTTDVFWKIYNTNGQEIKSGEIQKANRWTTEIQDLNSGIHFIQIVGKEINITYKIVKK